MNLSVDVKGLEGALARLSPLTDGEMLRVMHAIDAKAREQVAVTFNAARDPMTGTAWKPTSNFTLSLRPSGGGRTLIATGGAGLFGSILARAPQVTADTVVIGTNKIYGSVIQEGKDVSPKRAKFLSIPNTKEAARVGSPRRFPRPLFFVPLRRSLSTSSTAQAGARTVRGNARGGMLAESDGRGGLNVQYWLKDHVQGVQRRFLGVSRVGPNYAGQLEATTIAMIRRVIEGRAAAGGAA